MQPRPRRILTATLVVLALALGATACTATPAGPPRTPRQERDAMVQFLTDSTTQLPDNDWYARIVAGAQTCGKDKDGAYYVFDLWAPAGTDRDGDAEKIAAYWKSLGMKVSLIDTAPHPTVYGSGGPVQRASFDTLTGDDMYTMSGIAWCQLGDPYDFNLEDDAQRDALKILPGDEYFRPDPGIDPLPYQLKSPAPPATPGQDPTAPATTPPAPAGDGPTTPAPTPNSPAS